MEGWLKNVEQTKWFSQKKAVLNRNCLSVRRYQKRNLIIGWALFANALITYALTVEPTVSFWDAGEYIATSAKLGVAHPPGAPLFQMIGAFFSIFAINQGKIALLVNHVSCLSSAFTVLFLFWTITNLTTKMLPKENVSNSKYLIVLGSGLVGALSFTYSDSFWFNATETEVYAMASFIMALLLWLGLKWTDNIGKPRSGKWLLLISFIIGLTFGIQFMGFLAIPSLVLMWYFKKYKKVTFKTFVVVHIFAVALLFLIFKYSLTYVLKIFAWGEVFFINELGLPFNMGSLVIGLLFALLFGIGLWYTSKNGWYGLNSAILSILFLFLGFSSWLLLPIRASVNVGINENDPSDARTLLAYYNREQYGGELSSLYGAYYTDRFAAAEGTKDDHPKYERNDILGKYVVVNDYKDAIQGPNKRHMGFLPRMWSTEHAQNYHLFFGPIEFHIKPQFIGESSLREAVRNFKNAYQNGDVDHEGYIKFLDDFRDYIEIQPPSIWDNVRFMLYYQFNYMYIRYFMWNFVGRQNDIQGRYDGNGNWLSGIHFMDEIRLGSQQNLPIDVENNKARNTYFFLPLLLGLIGIVAQVKGDPKHFWVLLVFFLFSGIAIQFYTNPHIFQPRERDYSLVGSFYVFSIWVGIGVCGIYQALRSYGKPKVIGFFTVLICFCTVPLLMATQNWDDHDRSDRYTARASAKAYLDSTQKDAGALLFTIGDNDNFPLWYLQEVEGYRTDTRVIVTTYFATDWYIDQMKRKAYQSDPIPSQLSHNKYSYGTRDVMYHRSITDERWNIKDFMNWIGSDHPKTKLRYVLEQQGIDLSEYPNSTLNLVYYPTNKIRIPVNKEKVLENGLVKEKDSTQIVEYIDIDLPGYLTKNRMMMLDIIANNNWERPIYFSGGSFEDDEYIWMKDYLQQDGLAYKLVPIKTAYEGGFEMGRIDGDLSYDIVKNWDWGNSGNPKIYHDPQTRKQFGVTFRLSLARLMEELIAAHKMDEAKEIIALAMQNIPFESYGYYAFIEPFLGGYYKVGDINNARRLFEKLKMVYQSQLNYYAEMDLDEQYVNIEPIFSGMQSYGRILTLVQNHDEPKKAATEKVIFENYVSSFENIIAYD